MNNPYRVVLVDGGEIEIHDAVWLDHRTPSKKDANENGKVLTLVGFQDWESIVKHELWMPYPQKDKADGI